MNRRIVLLAVASLSLLLGQDSFTGVPRIVAVGDIHGGFEEFVTVLRQAGVIDSENKWTGGPTHLVQIGDVLDRGADSRKALDLLASLEGPAKRAKGRVHALLGNHEAMNIYGDLRYVAPGEFAAFATPGSLALRDRAFKKMADPAQKSSTAYREQWERLHPLGWVEHRQAFATDGQYGKILVERNAAVKINDTLFVHAGISPKFADLSLRELNERVRSELKDLSLLKGGIVMDEEGPLWYRGMATEPEENLASHVNTVLEKFGVQRIVVGHTPTQGAIMPRFGGRIVLIDVGLSPGYNASLACLLMENGQVSALHRGTKIPLPSTPEGLPAYLKAAAELDPPGTKLRQFVEKLR